MSDTSEERVAFQFPETFIHLGEGGSATPLEVTESFWPDLGAGKLDHLGPGRLISFSEFSEDWDVWEVHPNGEEIVCLVSGKIELLMEMPDGSERSETLERPGAFVRVPRGTWHSARLHEPSLVLFVTAGEGTQHRPA